MKKKIFYSKKSTDYTSLSKQKTNTKYACSEKEYIRKAYLKQKKRALCKNCRKKISGYDIEVNKIKFKICKYCNHLNGIHEETIDFFKKIYVENKGKNFTGGYQSNNYNQKVKCIYIPKIKFLKEIIGTKKILDLGSGSGYFQAACEKLKIKCLGLEINEALVNYSKNKLKLNEVKLIKADKINNFVLNHKYDCLSLINVLEHLLYPNEIFKYFKNSSAKYMFINVPLFSFRALVENAFINNERKLLGSSHTHLYTKESLEYLFKKNNLKIIGEWWYGLDFVDLGENLKKIIKFEKKNTNSYEKFFGNLVDKFQSILDKNKLSSEVHYVVKKK